MSEVTRLLEALAGTRMATESPGQTPQPTALVHEAWLKLMDSGREVWPNSRHFIAAAAEAMGRIMVDRARRKATRKHGGTLARVPLEGLDIAAPTTDENLLRVDEALKRLAEQDPQSAEIVKLRFFVGLTTTETAQALGISSATVKRQWAYARAWLFREIEADDTG
jgi:RNA polymerase sigma factor (TIGR02999 family)